MSPSKSAAKRSNSSANNPLGSDAPSSLDNANNMSDDASTNNSNRPAPMTPLQNTLMIGLGICCLLSVSANFLHSDTFDHHASTTNSAVARAMKDFKRHALRKKSPAQVAAESAHDKHLQFIKGEHGLLGADELVALDDPEGQHEDNDPEHVDVELIRNPNVLPPSKIGSLECSAFGGPPTQEESLDMVYWHDIPSDAQYISPLKAKKGERRQYLTFEPDGGACIVACVAIAL